MAFTLYFKMGSCVTVHIIVLRRSVSENFVMSAIMIAGEKRVAAESHLFHTCFFYVYLAKFFFLSFTDS